MDKYEHFGKQQFLYPSDAVQNQTPSRLNGISKKEEDIFRSLGACFLQDVGQKLQLSQLVINTALVYMHRLYMLRPFTKGATATNECDCWQFTEYAALSGQDMKMLLAVLYFASKCEENMRKTEHVLKVAWPFMHQCSTFPALNTPKYEAMVSELHNNEEELLKIIGFALVIEHPHTTVVKTCQIIRANKDLAQTAYFLATASLQLTTFCLELLPQKVATVCIHVALKWSEYKVPLSFENKPWYSYVDPAITAEELDYEARRFIKCIEDCPPKLQNKLLKWKSTAHRTEADAETNNLPARSKPAVHTTSSPHPQPSQSSGSIPSPASSVPSSPAVPGETKQSSKSSTKIPFNMYKNRQVHAPPLPAVVPVANSVGHSSSGSRDRERQHITQSHHSHSLVKRPLEADSSRRDSSQHLSLQHTRVGSDSVKDNGKHYRPSKHEAEVEEPSAKRHRSDVKDYSKLSEGHRSSHMSKLLTPVEKPHDHGPHAKLIRPEMVTDDLSRLLKTDPAGRMESVFKPEITFKMDPPFKTESVFKTDPMFHHSSLSHGELPDRGHLVNKHRTHGVPVQPQLKHANSSHSVSGHGHSERLPSSSQRRLHHNSHGHPPKISYGDKNFPSGAAVDFTNLPHQESSISSKTLQTTRPPVPLTSVEHK